MLRWISLTVTMPLLAIPAPAADAPDVALTARKVREIIAHRGSSADRPENTLAAFRRAIEAGAAVTEVDVRTTRDGALVCLHDADLSRTTDGKGNVGDKTLKEIKELDAGSRFETRCRRHRNLGGRHIASHRCEEEIVVSVPVAVIRNPCGSTLVQSDGRVPVVGGMARHPHFAGPFLTVERLEEDVAVAFAERLPGERKLSLAVCRQARIDVR